MPTRWGQSYFKRKKNKPRCISHLKMSKEQWKQLPNHVLKEWPLAIDQVDIFVVRCFELMQLGQCSLYA